MRSSVLLAITALLPLAVTPAHVADQFVIDLTYDSLPNVVRPEMHPNIRVHHGLHVMVIPYLSETRLDIKRILRNYVVPIGSSISIINGLII